MNSINSKVGLTVTWMCAFQESCKVNQREGKNVGSQGIFSKKHSTICCKKNVSNIFSFLVEPFIFLSSCHLHVILARLQPHPRLRAQQVQLPYSTWAQVINEKRTENKQKFASLESGIRLIWVVFC